MIVRDATRADGPALLEIFRRTPLDAGTAFVLDRSPDFSALLELRGHHRTLVACDAQRIAGMVTALWHEVEDPDGSARVGEIVDLRVANWARGSRTAAQLLREVRRTFDAEGVAWALCLIGDRNGAARTLTGGKAGLPCLKPLTRWASVHFIAWRVPLLQPRGVEVREAVPSDEAALESLVESVARQRHFVPRPYFVWPDPTGRHRAWLALQAGTPVGALVTWDGDGVRRLRVVRHRWQDAPLRALAAVASKAGVAPALPAAGDVLRVWATRWVAVRSGRLDVARALVRASLRCAAAHRIHVLQVNLPESDPLLRALPALPRSTYWSTLYGCCINPFPAASDAVGPRRPCHHADIALV